MNTNNKIRIVLVETSHPGNIGAVARAMKTMEIEQLVLVNPKNFPHAEATARAAGADEILAGATITPSLERAVADCQVIFGTSTRHRDLPITLLDPRVAATKILKAEPQQIAIIFGRENNGLSNTELACCHYHICIPTNQNFSSLNLAAAVQIVAYEIKMASLAVANSSASIDQPMANPADDLATAHELELFYGHLHEVLMKTKFINPRQPGKMMLRLKRLFNRAFPTKIEINILRGILTTMGKNLENQ